jgi:hypothetical protein
MKVELLYFDGCPTYSQALDNLLQALALERQVADVEMIRVRDAADADVKRFIGSPTIRLDGVDIEWPTVDFQRHFYGCRMYVEGQRNVGWPSVDRIREAIQRQRAAG